MKTDVSLFQDYKDLSLKDLYEGHVRAAWESTSVLCPVNSKSLKRLEKKNQLADTATYFLVEVISAALNADCGKCVCECIDTKHTSRHNLLEILRYCPVVRTAGTVLEPAVAKIYEKLLVAAAQFPDEAKSMSLVKILLEKKVSIHDIEKRHIFPLDGIKKEIHFRHYPYSWGGKSELETLETVFRSYQSRVFYLKKNFGSDEWQDTLSMSKRN